MRDKREIEPVAAAPRLLQIVEQLIKELHAGRQPSVLLDSALDADLGLDSLSRAELLLRIEQAFGVSLSEQVLASAETPRDLLRAALAAAPSAQSNTAANAVTASIPEQPQVQAPHDADTLLGVLDWHVQQHAERAHVFLYQGENEQPLTITYLRLQQKAEAVAAGLQAAGVEPQQTVGLMLPTGEDYLYGFFATLMCGAIPVPIYPPTRPSQLEDHLHRQVGILNNAQARALITVDEAVQVANMLKGQVETLRKVTTCDKLGQSGETLLRPQVQGQDTAFIQYTSGSTGQPKGVVLTHQDLLTNIRVMGEVNRVTSKDCFVSWLPLYHDMGLIGAWLGSLFYAMPLVLMSPLAFLSKPTRWLWAIHKHRGSLSAAPNFAYELCLNKIPDEALQGLDLSCWRRAYNGAEPVNPSTLRGFTERFGEYGFDAKAMAPVYGLAEATVGLAFPTTDRVPLIDRIQRDTYQTTGHAVIETDPEQPILEIPACGHPLPGYQFRVVDASGFEAPERHEGKLQFNGPSATQGYYRNPDATRALFEGEWLNTGDLAYIANGDLYLTGRVKDLIIRGGRNIYPYELEQAVGDLPQIRKGCVAVFGVTPQGGDQSKRASEQLVVVAESRLTEQEDSVGNGIADAEQSIRRVSAELLALPADEILIVPPHTVLKTSSGKIRRSAMRELYQQGRLQRGLSRQGNKPGWRRAIWWQLLRFNLASIRPRWRRVKRRLSEQLYAGYALILLALLALPAWVAAVCLPSLRLRWSAVRICTRTLFALAGVSLSVRNRDKLPANQQGVIVANHSSYLDGAALIATLPGPVVFVAKKELQGNVFARLFLQRLNVQFVERFDAKQGLEDAKQLTERLQQGCSLMYFPEGTFTRSPGLLPFRMGAFVTASENRLPILPVLIRGTRSILRGNDLFAHHGNIRVQIEAPIQTQLTGWEGAIALRDQTRELMLKGLGEPDVAFNPLQDGNTG